MTLALEINDVALVLAGDGEILAEEPGYAMLDGARPRPARRPRGARGSSRSSPRLVTGRISARRLCRGRCRRPRRRPRSPTRSSRSSSRRTSAHGSDVADRQRRRGTRASSSRCCSASRRRQASSRSASSMPVSPPLRSSPRPRACCSSSLRCIAPRSRCSTTRATCAARGSRSCSSMAGLRCSRRGSTMIASAFVRKTRFDPLHQAATEQRLCDGLPAGSTRCAPAGRSSIEVESGDATHAVELDGRRLCRRPRLRSTTSTCARCSAPGPAAARCTCGFRSASRACPDSTSTWRRSGTAR